MQNVTIVQRVLPHYRVPFFRGLHDVLRARGVELSVVHGAERPGSVPRTVDVNEPWARRVENRYLRVGRAGAVWQPVLGAAIRSDLVVLEHAGQAIANIALLAARRLSRPPRLAFWGHGRNYQATSKGGAIERFKAWVSTTVDWWFAYTELSARDIRARGVPTERITVVDNTIDNDTLALAVATIRPSELAALRTKLELGQGARVGLYCGGLHRDKNIDFLLAAARRIRELVPDFVLIVIGDGPELPKVLAAAGAPEIRYVGAVYGAERAPYFALARALLMPAHVGLVAVDSFVTGVPMLAVRSAHHSPEIEYIIDGVNGVLTGSTIEEYAGAVRRVIEDDGLHARLTAECRRAATHYTLDNMISRFAGGVHACLAS